jgi:hypothetical protein
MELHARTRVRLPSNERLQYYNRTKETGNTPIRIQSKVPMPFNYPPFRSLIASAGGFFDADILNWQI